MFSIFACWYKKLQLWLSFLCCRWSELVRKLTLSPNMVQLMEKLSTRVTLAKNVIQLTVLFSLWCLCLHTALYNVIWFDHLGKLSIFVLHATAPVETKSADFYESDEDEKHWIELKLCDCVQSCVYFLWNVVGHMSRRFFGTRIWKKNGSIIKCYARWQLCVVGVVYYCCLLWKCALFSRLWVKALAQALRLLLVSGRQ